MENFAYIQDMLYRITAYSCEFHSVVYIRENYYNWAIYRAVTEFRGNF